MLPLPRGAIWQTFFLLSVVLFINEVHSEGRVVCYYTNWSVYRPGTAKFNPQNINPYLCTHLVYAFGGFTKDNQMKPFDKYQDIEQGGYAKFTGLKTYNKQLKTMIAIGGWNEASSRFSPLVASPERRQKFIKNILKFLRQNHFDGIDLDWEYPAHREGGKERDRDNYAQFVQELRAEFEREAEKTGRPRLLLTMAVPAGIEYIEKGYDIPKLNKYLDWFNLLTYDFHSSHEPSVNHHAPLYSLEEESEYNYDTELNIDYSLKFYLKAGADRDKLVLGIPTYGRSFTLINEDSTEIGAPSEGPGEQGDATREKGYLAYYEICQNLKDDQEWTVVKPNSNAMGPYAYRRNQWVGYDDEDIVRKKAQYAVEHGLGGIMFWAIDNDDFRGTCSGKPYPLIEAAKEAMLEGLGVGINEVTNSLPKKALRSHSRENSQSPRNRIADLDRKQTTRRPVSASRKQSTTELPKTVIKLTEAEGSSLYIGGRTTTPPPPTTPDPGTDFKCEEEGFFQHPRDCKKYYWCLDSGPSGLGIVGHQFTCPSGLYFNPAADSCDFARNVPCKIKKSTTSAPTTTTSTTPHPTTALNRVTSATSRNTFLRTTTIRRKTTTSTEAPAKEEDEEVNDYEEEEETAPAQHKDRDPEEDPKVIKELIDLIRKVGGIEELEKHLLRKEDGSISLKEQSSALPGIATTPSSIAKTLYDKVLSRPNTYNSFRNRLTSSTLYKNNAQVRADEESSGRSKYEEEYEQDEEVGRSSSGYSKYSSVVRSRQGPQNEGLEKFSESEGFLKEKKQYVTINRNRGTAIGTQYVTDEDEEREEENEADEEVLKAVSEASENTAHLRGASTPVYSSIRRTKVIIESSDPDEVEELTVQRDNNEKKIYATLNRSRGRFTTTEIPSTVTNEGLSTTNRYKYFERTRPTKSSVSIKNSDDGESADDDAVGEDQQKVTVQLTAEKDSATQKSQHTRLYASVGHRSTTSAAEAASTETPTTTTPTSKTNPLAENPSTETPEPISITAISPSTPATISRNTNLPELIASSHPTASIITISTTSPAINRVDSDSGLDYDSTSTLATSPNAGLKSGDDSLPDALSLDLNFFVREPRPTTESGPDTTNQDPNADSSASPGAAKATTKTLINVGTTDITDVFDPDDDKVNNISRNPANPKFKYTSVRTRNLTKTRTTSATSVNENPNQIAETTTDKQNNTNNHRFKDNLKLSNDKSRSSNNLLRGNSVKYSDGRRQNQAQKEINRSDLLFNRKSQNQTQQTYSTTEPTPTNDFPGTVSSPRPFGFPRRRTRPPSVPPTAAISSTDGESTPSAGEDGDEPSNKRATNRLRKRYQFNRSRTTTPRITTTTTTESTTTTISHEDDSIQSIDQVNKFDDASITTIGTNSTESTLGSRPPASRSRRIKVLRYRRPVGSNNTTLINSSNNSITSVTNITDTTLDLDNTDSLSFDRNVENSQPEILNNTRHLETTPTETEIPETPSYVTPPTTKRFRKIVRRLKRPLFNQSSTPDNVPDEFTTRAAVTVQTSTVAPTTAAGFKRRKESRYNFNRNKPSQDKNQQINQEEINAGQKIPPRFSPSSRRTGSERKNIASRTPLFSKGNRVRFNSRGPTSTETTNTEPVEKHEEKKTTSKAVEETEDDHGDHEGHTTEYVLENNVTNFEISLKEEDVRVSATDSTTNGEQPKVTTSEKGSEDDLVEMTTEQSVDDLKTEPNVKEVYQNKTSNEENNLQTILDQSKNTDQMNFGNTRFSSVPENETDSSPSINVTDEHKHTEVTTSRENLDLQKIRNKVKSAQLKPNANDKEEGVINKSLKKLLLEKQVKKANVGEDDDESYELEATTHYDVDARTTTAELLADEKILSTASATRSNDDEVTTNKTLKDDSTTKVTSNTLEGKDSVEATDETKKDDELKEVETTSITPETTPSMGSEFVKSSINETVQNNELKEIRSTADANILILTSTSATDIAEPNNGLQLDTTEEAVADYSTTTINPLVRRRFMPSSKKKKTGKELNTVQENPDEAPSTFRPTPKRKLVDKRPYIPRKPTLSLISTTPRVTATKTRNKFVPRKFGQFQPPSNIGSSQGNSKNSQLPGVNRFKDNHLSPKHQEEDENVEDEDEYEDDSDPEDDENEENKPMESSGKKSNEQTSKEYEDDDEDGEEDEDDEDYDGEDNDKHLENSDSHETVAGHRVPPGSRPGKSSTNVPFNPRNRQSPSLPNNANRARVVNRPVLSIAKPVKLEFEPSTLPTVTKPAPFIPSHTPTYERKYSGSSTTDSSEISAADDSLEDLNIEAINARNKKIFDINSKKHTTLKPKLFTNHDSSEQDSDEQEPQKQIITTHQQPTNTETITKTEDKVESVDGVNQHNNNTYYEGREYGFITTTPSTPTTHLNTDLTFPTSNEISPQDIDDSGRAQQMPTTTVPPTTTLLHVFTLTDDDGHTNRPIAASDNFIPSESDTVEPKHKVVEINRIVEITSKEDKLRRKSKANQGLSYETVGSTSLKVESLPHLEQLGEISVVKYVHLVNGDDITIDGHSAVADYTPTESSATAPAESTSRRSPPVRNSVPEEVIERHEYVRAASERKAKSLVPEVILEAIETSTIPLEGLFDSARKGKELNASENVVYDYKSSQAPSNELRDSTKGSPIIGTGQQNAPSSTYDAADHASAKPSTVAAALFPAYVRPIVPLLRPESNESSPLVISIANLDKVILSKVGKVNAFQPASDSSAESSSSHVAIIKPPTNHFQAQTIDGKSSGSGGYSSASSVGDVSHSSDAINSNSNDSFNTNPSYNNSTTNNDIGTSVNTDSNNRIQNRLSTVNGSSSISEEVSFSSESHVVHEHKTRKHKSKKSQHFSKNTESSSSETIAEKMTTSRAI